MPTKTFTELRALARARGLKGFSKLSRDELEKRLSAKSGKRPATADKSLKAAPKKNSADDKPASKSSANKSAPVREKMTRASSRPQAATSAPAPQWEWVSHDRRQTADEEQVEDAKYVTVLRGRPAPGIGATDLGEDIDNLPPVTEATLCLLPQKPGVLHGYWVIPPGSALDLRSLKLRLGRIAGDAFEIIEEMTLPHERGHWYFHLDGATDPGVVYLQLGFYDASGNFITATRRGVARIPSLHASARTDHLWWVSDEQFRAMYQRAGGFAHTGRLGWAASISSPGGAPPTGSSERLAWPGNVSSPHK
jgi:hypothetical protein